MFTISLDKRPIEHLENTLEQIRKKSIPYAVRNTLNAAVYETSELAKKEIGSKFIERNQYSRRSVRYNKVVQRNIDQMMAEVGSVQEYMAKQEHGFVTHATGKHGIAIPTPYASGEGSARVRKKVIRAANRLNKIRIAKGLASEYAATYKNRHQRLIRMVQDSLELGFRTIFWMSKRSSHSGFYRLRGGPRLTKRGWPEGLELEQLYLVNKSLTETEEHKWLLPSVTHVRSIMGRLYQKALIEEIGQARIKYR